MRKKAVALTSQWKALVAGKLERAAAKKEADAGEIFIIDAIHDTHDASKIKKTSTPTAASAVRGNAKPGSASLQPTVNVVLKKGRVPVQSAMHPLGRSTCTAREEFGARDQTEWSIVDWEVHESVSIRARAARNRTTCLCCRMYVVTAAAIMLLLTKGVDCYSPFPAPHHFFAAGAGSAGQQQSPSKIPAPGQLARPRDSVVFKGNGKVVFFQTSRHSWKALPPTSQCPNEQQNCDAT